MTLHTLLQEPRSWPQEEWDERVREFALLNRIVPAADIDRMRESGVTIKRCCLWRTDPVKIAFSIRGKGRYSVDVYAGDPVLVRVDNKDLNGTTPTTIEELSKLIASLAQQAR